MYIIAFFGFLMVVLSLIMIVNPQYWAHGIVKFSEKFWFHPFEIISRIAFGIVFVIFAEQTLYPTLMKFIGYLLIIVGAGLIFTPQSKHKQFAVWSAERFKNLFRPLGFISLIFGAFLVYAAISR